MISFKLDLGRKEVRCSVGCLDFVRLGKIKSEFQCPCYAFVIITSDIIECQSKIELEVALVTLLVALLFLSFGSCRFG